MSKRTTDLYLTDILEAIGKIEEYTKGLSLDQFRADGKTIDAVVRNLAIIGEAARQISSEVRSKYPNVAWEEMIGMRDKVSHEYFGVDLKIIWETVENDLTALREQINRVMAGL